MIIQYLGISYITIEKGVESKMSRLADTNHRLENIVSKLARKGYTQRVVSVSRSAKVRILDMLAV